MRGQWDLLPPQYPWVALGSAPASSNSRSYPPDTHMELAQQDTRRLRDAGVDGFQIDSAYGALFGPEITESKVTHDSRTRA